MNHAELKDSPHRNREVEERGHASAAVAPKEVDGAGATITASRLPDVQALVKRIDKGKPQPGDVDSLRREIEADGGRSLAALSSHAQIRQLIESANATQSARMVMHAEVRRMREALGYSQSAGTEQALIEHIGLCWLRLQMAETALTNATARQHTLNEGRYWEQRLSEAQARYLRALALLERLRRYAPSVQINIASQQVVKNS